MGPHDSHRLEAQFRPLTRPTRAGVIAAVLIGPLAWLVALIMIALLVRRADLIEFGLLVAFGSFLAALVILALLRTGRLREGREDAEGR